MKKYRAHTGMSFRAFLAGWLVGSAVLVGALIAWQWSADILGMMRAAAATPPATHAQKKLLNIEPLPTYTPQQIAWHQRAEATHNPQKEDTVQLTRRVVRTLVLDEVSSFVRRAALVGDVVKHVATE